MEADSQLYRETNRRAILLSSAFVPLIRMAILAGFTMTLLVGGAMVIDGTLAVGFFSVLVFMTQRLLWPLTRLGETFDLYQRAMASTERVMGLLDAPALIRKKIMRATTDSMPGVDFDNLGPGVANLLAIHQAFTGWSETQMRAHFAGMRYGDLKKTVAETVVAGLEPIQRRYAEITADPGYLKQVLRESAERVAPLANATVRLVKQRMGIYTD